MFTLHWHPVNSFITIRHQDEIFMVTLVNYLLFYLIFSFLCIFNHFCWWVSEFLINLAIYAVFLCSWHWFLECHVDLLVCYYVFSWYGLISWKCINLVLEERFVGRDFVNFLPFTPWNRYKVCIHLACCCLWLLSSIMHVVCLLYVFKVGTVL